MKNDKTVAAEMLIHIAQKCSYCMSGIRQDVNECKACPSSGKSKCSLWKYRKGAFSKRSSDIDMVTSAISKHCGECVGKSEIIKCTSDGSKGYHKCELFDYRLTALDVKIRSKVKTTEISTKSVQIEEGYSPVCTNS